MRPVAADGSFPFVPGSNIRSLIAQALEEAREEFAEIVQRKLEALMGDGDGSSRAPVAPKGRAPRASRPGPRRSGKPAPASDGARRTRVNEAHMADLRARVLSAMPLGTPLKRAHIIERASIAEDDEARVAGVLRKLKDEGVLEMRGVKASAVYTRVG